MNVKSKENQENSAVELVIEVGAEEFEAAVDKVYRKNRKSIAVPGFRKGKAPRKIIEGMYGSGVFYEDAINDLYPEAYTQAVEQENLDELIRIFVYANMDTRVRRVMDVDKVDEKEALKRIKRIDKERREYCRYFAGRDWMDMEHYDLPINSSRLEFEQMVVLIKDYIRLKGFTWEGL